ncbi:MULTISPECIES: D-alanyl-D-alanine carboxypeptidase family protein [Nocardiaceae]|uniref:D-alanyl-D-alanine carboxypeptidase (Penicillin-binding protein 5/6) n=1 Tax=Rhodococcoides corynebacterioides TaxID=53972 RepID=A0ABS2KQE7_9NOCA|nr:MULTISPECIES: D-alanyl-D-alanine carboxypeptidase family protein [Rhodococcus]MBM7414172.1 D-alanyl-D-alanine carboxypeptidase (penicillin-binding protein 5/6) [Rhodococcus corynebacterioides]MBP1116635.1 D-alanyl-D-alanine carboxypeptidase (penicillin-binding protein 5/6) [Rhodococcus sp. PvP016]
MNIHDRTRRGRRTAASIATAVVLVSTPAVLPGLAGAQPAPPPTSTPFRTPDTDACPHRDVPPPAIDASEVPAPGDAEPQPVPVPAQTVGGEELAACGVITAAGAPALPADISAAGWVLTDLDSGAVVAAKDPHGRYRPASTIKVLLALVALDELDLDRTVVATAEDAAAEGSAVGIGAGGVYSVRQLMQGLVMASGNDAAHALAVQLGGVDTAVEKMNAKARALGALDTRTASPSGLDGPGMACSPYDLALIFRAAMDNPTFAELVATESVPFPGYPKDASKPDNPSRPDMPGVPVNPDLPLNEDRPGFTLASDNALLFNYPDALGGKNGYTDDARQTFVGAAERGGRRLAVSLMNADVLPIRPWEQAARLLDYGFTQPADTAVGTLVTGNPDAAPASTTASTPTSTAPTDRRTEASTGGAYAGVDDESDAAIRVGAGVLGLIVVVGLLLWARTLHRRRS